MNKWKCGICNSEFDNYQAQGFNGIIYCPLCYFKELYKREKTKNDKAIEFISEYRNGWNNWFEFTIQDKTQLLEILKGESNDL